MSYGNWKHAYQTIEEHDGMLYLVWHDFQPDTPEEILNWYPTGISLYGFRQRYGQENPVGRTVTKTYQGFYTDKDGTFAIRIEANAPAERATHQPIPCPKQRGKQYPTHYKNGYWYRETPKQGFIALF